MKRSIVTLAGLLALSAAAGFTLSGCSSTATQQSTGEYIDDAATTAKVKAAFVRDPVVQALDVGVDTFKGTVQLNGFVDTQEQRSRAEQIARGVPGVTDVQNRLSVKAPAGTQQTQQTR